MISTGIVDFQAHSVFLNTGRPGASCSDAAARAVDVRAAVDPKHEFALFNDVQGADIGEADRESPQRSVRNDPFSAQTDAPEQLREQVVRLTICVEAEHGFLKR